MKDLNFKFLLACLAVLVLTIFAYRSFDQMSGKFTSGDKIMTTTSVAQVTEMGATTTANLISGKFDLIDQDGNRKTQNDFRGRITLIYFGYSYCPDICPQALSNISQALEILQDKAKNINVVFISVDPERDRVSDLKRYLTNFHPRITALTGTAQQIASAAASFRAYYAKVNDERANDYLIDHSSIIYVMDQRGRFLSSFNHQSSSQEMANALSKLL